MRIVLLALTSFAVAEGQSADLAAVLQAIDVRYGSMQQYLIEFQRLNLFARNQIRKDYVLKLDRKEFAPSINWGPAGGGILARSGNSFRYEASSMGGSLVWVTDGQRTWKYKSPENRYSESDAQPWPTASAPGKGLPGIEWRYLMRFRGLAGVSRRVRLVDDNLHRTEFCAGASVLLEVGSTDHTGLPTEFVRVLMPSGFVCQSYTETHTNVPDVWTVDTIVLRAHDFPKEVDPHLFIFIAPDRAKKVGYVD
jgi:hypothetical protein